MNKTCTITKDCGLSNRIKSILSALSLYDEVTTVVDADSYIFPSIKKVDTIINPYLNWRLEVLPEEEHFIDKYKTIDFLYEKTPKYFIEKYLKYVKKLQINPDILKYVDGFVKDWDNDVIGVHIRTWHSDGPRMLWHDNSIFEAEIDKFPVNKKIFLCSDNPETIKYFCKKYSERIITHTQKLHNTSLGQINPYDQYQNDTQLIVDGFIDCLLLSKCNSIIGTWCSTFTEVAWWFGECKSEVIIPRPINFDYETDKNVFLAK